MELSIVSLTIAPLYANRTVGRYLKDFANSPEASVFHFLPNPKLFGILSFAASVVRLYERTWRNPHVKESVELDRSVPVHFLDRVYAIS